jgi:alkanesulfonate monooxygenase SsuD/methylene tetrahydromethanopterin reductase-like flavin-dependent oxidoreductase (luciferase family)
MLNAKLDEWCEKEGRDPAAIERNVNLTFHMAATAKDLDRAEQQYRETWGPAAEVMRKRGAVIGTPDQAIDLVERFREAGAARLNIAIRPPADWDAARLGERGHPGVRHGSGALPWAGTGADVR